MSRRKQRIVLYNPSMVEPRGGFPVSKDQLPLPLLTIAAWPAREGYEIVLIDANLYDADEAHRRALEACEGALLFATTGILGFQVADGFFCSTKVRARHPKLPMFIGGWWASVVPEMQLATGLYDAVCLGQGEMTFLDLVHAVEAGAKLEDVPGLALWRDGRVVRTEHRAIVGWDKLLDPPWHLLDIAPYRDSQLSGRAPREASRMIMPPGSNGRPVWGITYFSSFGCPEPCTFCCSPAVTGQRWKAMPAQRMLDDLCGLHERWGFDSVRFYDANFGVHEKRVQEFCSGLIERGSPFHWTAMMQAMSVLRWKPETLNVLRDSGLYHVLIGAETGDGEMLRAVGKHTKENDNVRSAALMDRLGICTLLTYILGYPNESTEQMLGTIDECRRIAAESPLARPVPWPFKPIPGTALYEKALACGFQPPRTLPEWGQAGEYHLWETQSWPNQIPAEVLRARKTFEHFYSLSLGIVRGRVGWWEERARRRLRSGDFRFARTEAKAFSVFHRVANGLRWFGRPEREIQSGVQTSQLSRRTSPTPMG